MGKLIRDLFMGPNNKAWDLARILAVKVVVAYTFAFLYALVWLGNVPDWSSLGVGYAGVMAGAAAFLGVKDALFNKTHEPPKVSVTGDFRADNVENVEMNR